MIYLHKVLPVFVLPIMLAIGFIIYGLVRNKKKIIIVVISLLYLFSTPFFSGQFFKLIEGDETRKTSKEVENADAVVVLSGMIGFTQTKNGLMPEWGDAADRFFEGIELIKANKANQLIFTGGKMPWNENNVTEGEVLKKYAIAFGIPDSIIKITNVVENTEDESKEVRSMLGKGKKIILVTSGFHINRAQRLFHKEGMKVITYPVDYKVGSGNKLTVLDFMPDAHSLMLTETGIRELIGRLFYLIKG